MFGILLFFIDCIWASLALFLFYGERYEDHNGMWNGHPTEDSLRLTHTGARKTWTACWNRISLVGMVQHESGWLFKHGIVQQHPEHCRSVFPLCQLSLFPAQNIPNA
jgi:hypothetical protein